VQALEGSRGRDRVDVLAVSLQGLAANHGAMFTNAGPFVLRNSLALIYNYENRRVQ